ncbi:hypothetical protein [Actinoalloteichus fjordicus]|uniref:hypothetical protein n=1 Tax=Actinoalloteichus fjordicus TaxID=1612552 RepID=UPI00095163AA|nr:hypothetical protein [Actinoalloteichus fjordicus]
MWPLFLHHRRLVTPTVFTDGAAAAHRATQTAQDPDHTRRHRLGQASLLLKAVAARQKLGDIDTAETLLPEATALTRHLDSRHSRPPPEPNTANSPEHAAVTELTRALTVFGDLPSHYQATCHRRLALALQRRAATALNTNPTPDHGDPLHTEATQDRRRAVVHRTRARELAPTTTPLPPSRPDHHTSVGDTTRPNQLTRPQGPARPDTDTPMFGPLLRPAPRRE